MLPESVRERVVEEQNELRDKITKLALFVYSAKIETVDEKHPCDGRIQRHLNGKT